jgi:hypothetical protein
MRDAIKRSSEVIRGHQRPFVAIVTHLMRDAIKRSSEVIRGHQRPFVAIVTHPTGEER